MKGGNGVSIPSSERPELALQLAGEWWMIAMTGLFKTVDPEIATEFMRPHIRQSGMEAGFYLNEMMPGENSVTRLAFNIVVGTKHVHVPSVVEITERGVVATMGGCWATSTDIQSCYCRLHEISIKGSCEVIDSEYDARLTEMPRPESPHCKVVIRKKDVPSEEWQDYGNTVQIMPDVDIPEDVMEKNRLAVLSDYWMTTVIGLAEAVGSKKAIEILRPCMVKHGVAWGLKFAERFDIKPGEKGISELVCILSQIMDLEGDILVGKGRVDKAIGTCPFVKSSKEVCNLFDSFVEGFFTSLDKEIKFNPYKVECPTLPACYWIFKT
jgi:hypothetical protein